MLLAILIAGFLLSLSYGGVNGQPGPEAGAAALPVLPGGSRPAAGLKPTAAPPVSAPQAASSSSVAIRNRVKSTQTVANGLARPTLKPPEARAAARVEPAAAPPADLPTSATVKGIFGYGQLLPLSCESRSAADWARHFGITIHELEFLARLPRTHNPETGFVGSVNGGWGNLPPEAYGVHAAPVARVLRDYGVQAQAVRGLAYDALRAEIAAGRPVIVWVTGHVQPGRGEPYAVDGAVVTVARYEHTVIVTGYDAQGVTILDGKNVYRRPLETFLQAWAPLENMAILWNDAVVKISGPRD